MKKSITTFLIILFLSIAVTYYHIQIINIRKEEKRKSELEGKQLISEREGLKENFFALDKEKSILYTSTQLLKDNLNTLAQAHDKDLEKAGINQENLLQQISILVNKNEDVLKAMSEKELEFNRELFSLQFKLKESEDKRKDLSEFISGKNEDSGKNLKTITELKERKTELEKKVSELTDKSKELNEKISSLERSKGDFMTMASGLKKEALEVKEKLAAAEKEITRFETNYDTAVLKRYKQKLDKGFNLEREDWVKKEKDFNDKLAKQDNDNKNMSLQLEDAKKLKQKINELESSIKKEQFNYHYTSGQNLFQKKMYKDAIVEFEKAKNLNPADAKAYYNLAIIYDEFLKDKKKAVENYKKYLALNPKAEDKIQIEEWIEEAGHKSD